MSSSWRMLVVRGLVGAALPVLAVAESVSFQNGVDDYTGAYDIRITSAGAFLDGSASQTYYVDGKTSAGAENDLFALMRFENIVGPGNGQIPPGATILSAQLQLTTGSVSATQDDRSVGPVGVGRLLVPFDSSTRWTSFGEEGPDFAGGDYDRPAGGCEGMAVGTLQLVDVTSIVQAWSNGEPNNGVIIICATTDGWQICATGNNDVAKRPKLIVEYARVRSRAVVFQQGVNEYFGTSMLRLSQSDTTDFGDSFATGSYLDSDDGGSYLVNAVVKFDDIFGGGVNQVAPEATILKAFLTLTTMPKTGSGGSYETRSRGRYDAHRLLVDIDWTLSDWSKPSLWSDFLNADGPTEADGEIGSVLASSRGMIWDSKAWFDVTQTVQAWQSGEPNYGLIVVPGLSDDHNGVNSPALTADGWKINWTGSPEERRPQLVVLVVSRRADFDLDTDVDQQDLNLFVDCATGPAIAYDSACEFADLDSDGDVDQVDFAVWQACFSGDGSPAAASCR